MCKVLENRSQQDEERMDQLTNQLKEARLLAEDADGKSDEVSTLIPCYILSQSLEKYVKNYYFESILSNLIFFISIILRFRCLKLHVPRFSGVP